MIALFHFKGICLLNDTLRRMTSVGYFNQVIQDIFSGFISGDVAVHCMRLKLTAAKWALDPQHMWVGIILLKNSLTIYLHKQNSFGILNVVDVTLSLSDWPAEQ